MDALAQAAEAVLRRHPAPALRLAELLSHVRAETGVATLAAARLRTALETHPERFRVLDPWRGPWRFVRRDATPPDAAEAWVVVVGDPGDRGEPGTSGSRLELRLRASMRWLGLALETESGSDVRHWHALVIAEGVARAALGRKVA